MNIAIFYALGIYIRSKDCIIPGHERMQRWSTVLSCVLAVQLVVVYASTLL
jgi:hypothetical protein